MKVLQLVKDLNRRINKSFKRFPFPLTYATAAMVILIVINHLDYRSQETMNILTRLAMTLALGIPLSLAIHVFFEMKSNIKAHFKILAHLAGTTVLLLYYFIFLKELNFVSGTRYIAYTIALYLVFSFIPYIKKKGHYEIYMIRLFSRFVVTYFYTLVLYLGFAAILATINLLFHAGISGKIYADIALILAGMFAPAFFLADIPQRQENLSVEHYPKVLKVLLQFIVTPLLTVYTIILYIYFGKIILAMEFPEGMVGNLVLWYAIISTIVLFLIYPLQRVSQWISLFRRLFPKAIIPLLGMMFVSIGIRINAYGVTEARYFVVIIGVWVTFVMLYYSFKKDIKNILLTITIASIAIISVTGFFSAYSISKWNQNKRFEDILVRNQMIGEQSQIIPPSKGKEIPVADQEEVSGILLYFSRYHDLNDIEYLPKEFKMSDMEAVFGFRLMNRYLIDQHNREYFNYSLYNENIFTNISEFDYFGEFASHSRDTQKQELGDYVIYYNYNDQSFVVISKENVVYQKSLTDIVAKIHQQDIQKDMTVQEMTFIDENEDVKIQMIFKHIHGYKDRIDNKISMNSTEFYTFVKLK